MPCWGTSEKQFVVIPPQTLPDELHNVPRNPSCLITFAHYEHNMTVTKAVLVRSQSEALESKEIAGKKMSTLYYSALNDMITS